MQMFVDSRELLAAAFAARFQQAVAEARGSKRFTLAIAGGSVAEAFLPPLAATRVDWSRVDVFWCDERAVPPDDAESNYRAAMNLLFGQPPANAAALHRMPADTTDLDAAGRVYEAELRRALGEPPQLDLVLIGAGPDGHICSLFPGHTLLQERERWVAAIYDSPKPPPRRLTLTMPLLETARSLVLGVFGDDKATIAREILENPDSRLPAALALRGNRNSACYLDRDAAGLLSRE
jgi:6-phosphogluconolactonase